jgi:hypothetical protein
MLVKIDIGALSKSQKINADLMTKINNKIFIKLDFDKLSQAGLRNEAQGKILMNVGFRSILVEQTKSTIPGFETLNCECPSAS